MEDNFDMQAAAASVSEGLGFEPSGNATDSSELDLDKVTEAAPTQTPVSEEAPAGEAAVETAPAAPTPAPAPTMLAPKTWRPDAAAKWETIDPTVQAEILKREEDVFRGISRYKNDADQWQATRSVIDPFLPALRQHGLDPIQHIGTLMQAHQLLALGSPQQKQQMFHSLARDYGVDLGQLASGQLPEVNPETEHLRTTVNNLQSALYNLQQQSAQQSQAKIVSEVEAFASDPANAYFSEAYEDMAKLLEADHNLSLKDAYEKAIWANPVTRAKEIRRLETEKAANSKAESEKAAEAAARKAAAARKTTGANVKTAAHTGESFVPAGTIDETLAATLASIRARS